MMTSEELKKIAFFSTLDNEEREKLLPLLHEHRVPAGKEIVREGDPGRRFYVLIKGQAQVIEELDSHRAKLLAELKEGDFFGELSILDEGPRSASVVAHSDCVLRFIAANEFKTLLLDHPEITLKVAQVLASRLRNADKEIRELTLFNL
jgi:CRP-like cAMP-binding protein